MPMTALNLESVLPNTQCCVYLRYLSENHQEFVGTGLAELLGGRDDVPDATRWAAFETQIEPDDLQWLTQSHDGNRTDDTLDSYSIRLKNKAGEWIYVQCFETDYQIDCASRLGVRLGVIVQANQTTEITSVTQDYSADWALLAKKTPAIIARIDADGNATFANDLALNILGIACKGSQFGPIYSNRYPFTSSGLSKSALMKLLLSIDPRHETWSIRDQILPRRSILCLKLGDRPRWARRLSSGKSTGGAATLPALPERHPGRFDLLFAASLIPL